MHLHWPLLFNLICWITTVTVEFVTNLMWSSTNEMGVRLFLQQHGFKEFYVYECVLSEYNETLPFIVFLCQEKNWMLLKLKYQDINDAIKQFVFNNRRLLYQMKINQLYEQVESDDA